MGCDGRATCLGTLTGAGAAGSLDSVSSSRANMQITVKQVHVELDDELRAIIDSVGVPDSRLERAELELKAAFNKSKPAWLDLLKHVVAMANSGGGAIIFGVDKNGNKAGLADSLLNDLDAANVSNKLGSYSLHGADVSCGRVSRQCGSCDCRVRAAYRTRDQQSA
jgi:hypothetical protein